MSRKASAFSLVLAAFSCLTHRATTVTFDAPTPALQQVGSIFDVSALRYYIDRTNRVVYVRNADASMLAQRLGAKRDGTSWSIGERDRVVSYEQRDPAQIDPKLEATEGDKGEYEKSICKVFKGGECINLVQNKTHEFLYSWKVAEGGVQMCESHESEKCQFTWTKYTLTTYPQKDCKGTPTQQTVLWPICQPH